MPRTVAFTPEKWAIWADCIFEIYRFRWRFWRKDRNRIYCRFWFTVFGIKGTAPSSENSKSFINQNVLVRPGLRKKMLRKSQFFTNWEKSQKIRILNLFFKILFSKKYIDTYFWNHQQIAEVMRFPKLGDIFQKSWLCPHKSSKNWKTHFWKP